MTDSGPIALQPRIKKSSSLRLWGVHLIRMAVLLGVLLVMRLQHDRLMVIGKSESLSSMELSEVVRFFPTAAKWGDAESHGGLQVLSTGGESLGYVIQTAPDSDRFLGFSGPTNLLIAFDPNDRIVGICILASDDTRDHVDLIRRSPGFFEAWHGLSWSDAAARKEVDGVAGATLTSMAMVQGLQQRLGATQLATKFPEPVQLTEVLKFFPKATRIEQDTSMDALWHVYEETAQPCGAILRTSPAADEIIGYQGPTESRIAFLSDGTIIGIAVAASFDNEPYVGYVRGEASFEKLLKTYTLDQWSELDIKQAGIEGVSGATMTSLAVAQGLVAAASKYEADLAKLSAQSHGYQIPRDWRTLSTIGIVLIALVIGFTSLRGKTWVRIALQMLVIGYLGLVNGDLLSMAMLAGWAQNGIPLQNALGLVVLAFAALASPIFARNNIYCSHVCPHGAVQQLLPRRWKRKTPLPTWLVGLLTAIRPFLIVWVILVSLLQLRFSLVDIEPFDAYAWRSAA